MLKRRSLEEIGCLTLLGREVGATDPFVFQTLVGLLLSNGPGTISAQGAKGAIPADGLESSARVQLNKGLIGFLTHSGFSHGGNGYQRIAFLIEQFKNTGLADPTDPDYGIDLEHQPPVPRLTTQATRRAKSRRATWTCRSSPVSTTLCSKTSR